MDKTISSFVSGFTLTGIRRSNGTLQSYADPGVYTDEWPEKIVFDHRTYSLDQITTAYGGHEEAIYV